MVANFLINELLTVLNSNKLETDECGLTSVQLAKIIDMLEENKLNAHYARLVLQELVVADGVAGKQVVKCPVEIVTRNNWFLITDEEQIRQFCKDAMDRNPKVVEKYRKGKEKMLYALAGEVAKAGEQKIDMARAVDMLKDMLK